MHLLARILYCLLSLIVSIKLLKYDSFFLIWRYGIRTVFLHHCFIFLVYPLVSLSVRMCVFFLNISSNFYLLLEWSNIKLKNLQQIFLNVIMYLYLYFVLIGKVKFFSQFFIKIHVLLNNELCMTINDKAKCINIDDNTELSNSDWWAWL